MSNPVETLPSELFLYITAFLAHPDLARLMRVSRRYQQLVEPLIWTKIEFHGYLQHKKNAYHELREDEKALNRPYDACSGDSSPAEEARNMFLRQFEGSLIDRDRAEHLAGLVRWLCLTVRADYGERIRDYWNALAMFTNLEYLEVHGGWEAACEVLPFMETAKPMSKLRVLKLHGYISAEFARHMCHFAPGLAELQLGILDRPIGSTLYHQRENPPPRKGPSRYDNEWLDEYTSDDSEFDYEQIAPRPLACLDSDLLVKRSSNITRLSLWRPAEAIHAADQHQGFGELYPAVTSDEQILKEWASLLRATRNTLEHLVLDQRPTGETIEQDGSDLQEFVVANCHGPGYDRFVEQVLPALLEEGSWPALKTIHLFGFEVGKWKLKEWVTGPRRPGVDLEGQLTKRFPGVDVIVGFGKRLLFNEGSGEVEIGGEMMFQWEDGSADGLPSDTDEERSI